MLKLLDAHGLIEPGDGAGDDATLADIAGAGGLEPAEDVPAPEEAGATRTSTSSRCGRAATTIRG